MHAVRPIAQNKSALPAAPFARASAPVRRAPVWILLGASLGLGITVVSLLALALVLGLVAAPGRMPMGSVVGGDGLGPVQIGSMSVADASTMLDLLEVDRLVTLYDGERTWPVRSIDLGIHVDGPATAARAAITGDMTLGERLEKAFGVAEVTPVFRVDVLRATQTLDALAPAADVAPGAEGLLRAGRTLDVPATVAALVADPAAVMRAGALQLAMVNLEAPSIVHVVRRGEELNLIAYRYQVSMADIIALNGLDDPDRIYPGQELLIPAGGEWHPSDVEAPPAPSDTGRSILISLRQQRIFAYEDGHLVRSTLVSTGRTGLETVLGDYHVYAKYPVTRMTGPDYDTPDVPWVMYFYQGYAIHGAYWHYTFGRPVSHGCVNLELDEARWFYEFAPIGTLVRVVND